MKSHDRKPYVWRLAPNLIPAIGTVLAICIVQFFTKLSEPDVQMAALFLILIALALIGLVMVAMLANLPGPIKWTLPEAVIYLIEGRPLKRGEYAEYLAAYTTEYHKKIEETPSGKKITSFEPTNELMLEKYNMKMNQAVGFLVEAARQGRVSIYAIDPEKNESIELSPPELLQSAGMNLMFNTWSTEPEPIRLNKSVQLKEYKHVTLVRDEVVALKNQFRPLFPGPQDMLSAYGKNSWFELVERKVVIIEDPENAPSKETK